MILKIEKSMKPLFIISAFYILLITAVSAQSNYCNCRDVEVPVVDFDPKITGKAYKDPHPGNNIQYVDKWKKGRITFVDGTSVSDKYLRYNGLLDELLWLRKSDYKTIMVEKNTVSLFEIFDEQGNPAALYRNQKVKHWYTGDSIDAYVQILVEGKLTLHVERKITELPNSNLLVHAFKYYLIRDGVTHTIRLNRQFLLRFFGDKKKDFRNILRKNNLNVKYEDQLIRAIALYNKKTS